MKKKTKNCQNVLQTLTQIGLYTYRIVINGRTWDGDRGERGRLRWRCLHVIGRVRAVHVHGRRSAGTGWRGRRERSGPWVTGSAGVRRRWWPETLSRYRGCLMVVIAHHLKNTHVRLNILLSSNVSIYRAIYVYCLHK